MDIPEFLLVHSVTVETYLGSGAYGETYADALPVACFVEQSVKMVRTPNGDQVASTLQLFAVSGQADLFAAGSRVTHDGLTTTVIMAANMDDGGMGVPQHTAVSCE